MSQPSQERRRNADTDAYFNALFDAAPQTLIPGGVRCSDGVDDMFVATLGAGVAVSVFDEGLKLGGLCYVSLAPPLLDAFPYFKDVPSDLLDKAFSPLDLLIAQIHAANAGQRRVLIRLMGAADLDGHSPDSGTKNAVFVKEYLSRKGLGVFNEDLGGPYIRRVHFFPHSGRAVRIVLKRGSDREYVQSLENAYHNK